MADLWQCPRVARGCSATRRMGRCTGFGGAPCREARAIGLVPHLSRGALPERTEPAHDRKSALVGRQLTHTPPSPPVRFDPPGVFAMRVARDFGVRCLWIMHPVWSVRPVGQDPVRPRHDPTGAMNRPRDCRACRSAESTASMEIPRFAQFNHHSASSCTIDPFPFIVDPGALPQSARTCPPAGLPNS